MPKKEQKKGRVERAITWFVLASLLASVVYAIVGIVRAGGDAGRPYDRLRSDYVLMLLQCLLGVGLVLLPSVLERRWKFAMTSRMNILFVLFLYGAIVLGEVQNFYYKVPHWDTILHTFSGAMLGAAGFQIIDTLNGSKSVRMHLTDTFVAVFSFCFALSLGTLWEIYEFIADGLFGLNMQKHTLENGTALVGALALQDTMKDLIVDAAGALAVILVGLIMTKVKAKRAARREPAQPDAE